MRRLLAAIAALGLLPAAACSSGHGGSPSGPHRATGQPLTVGFVNMESGAFGGFPEIRRDAEAAVRYVNEELGGARNRPLRLESCATDGTDDSSAACARQVLAAHPVAVLSGVDLGAGAAADVLEDAKVPFIGLTPGLGDELTAATTFMLAGGVTADLLAETEYVTGTLHATKVGVLYLELPGLEDAAVLAARAILEKRGVTDLKMVPEKAATPDYTASLRAATAGNPDVVMAVFPTDGCVKVLKAAATLKLKARLFLPSSCLAAGVFDAAGAQAEGVTFASALVPYTAAGDPAVATYLDRLRRYGPPGAAPSVLSEAGFAAVLDVQRLLAGLKKPTAAALVDRLKTARDEPGFLTAPATCDGQVVTLLPTVCNASVRLLTYRGGQFEDVTGDWVSGAALVKLLTG